MSLAKYKQKRSFTKTPEPQGGAPLLIKHRDKYASETPVIEKDKSVLSRNTLEQVAANPHPRT